MAAQSGNAERQLATAQQITHMGSWEWELSTNVVSWSDELYRIYGLEPRSCLITFELFLGKLHPEDRDRVQGEVRGAVERGGRFAYVERVLRPDGSMRILDTIGEALTDASGRVTGLLGTCRDVTEERVRDQKIRLYADIVRNVQIGLTVWALSDGGEAGDACLVAYNPASERIAGSSLEGAVGKTLREILPYAAGGQVERMIGAVARDGQVREVNVDRSRDPRKPNRAILVKAFPLPARCVGLAVEDVTEQTVARRLQAAEQKVLEQIAEGAPLPATLTAIVLAIEEHSPPAIGSILLLDAEGLHVRHGAAPHLPPEYLQAIDGKAIGPKAGSCGTAAFRKTAVFVEDIETDPLWDDYRAFALPYGLRACWSIPILSIDDCVLGTFAFYYGEVRRPTEVDLETAARATRLARIAIERTALEQQLRELSAHVESVREDERTGIAREIHDELGQSLTALKMDVAWIARRVGAPAGIERSVLLEKLGAIAQMTDEIIDNVRRISAALRPGVLDDLGLLAALEWEGQELERRTGIACAIQSNVDDAPLDRDLATAVFRIFQEALTNVTRHAEATRVDVSLELRDGWLHLEVKDDGKGIAPDVARSPRSLGLLGIRERALRLGGSASVTRGEAGGTVVSLAVPVARAPSSRRGAAPVGGPS